MLATAGRLKSGDFSRLEPGAKLSLFANLPPGRSFSCKRQMSLGPLVDSKNGLTDAEIQERLKKDGPNALVEKQKVPSPLCSAISGDRSRG